MITITLLLMLFSIAMNTRGSSVGKDLDEVVNEFKNGREFESKLLTSHTHSLNQNAEINLSSTGMEPPPYSPSAHPVSSTDARPPPSYSSLYGHPVKAMESKPFVINFDLVIPQENERSADISINMCDKETVTAVMSFLFFSGITVATIIHHFKNNSTKKLLQNNTLVLTPDNAHSTTLNNAQPTMNTTKLIRTTLKTLTPNTKQSSDSITAHGHVHIEHTHTMHKLAVYIAVTTALLIAACILALHMVKLHRQDVVTDMQQYYTGGASTAMQSNMNVPLHQHGNLI